MVKAPFWAEFNWEKNKMKSLLLAIALSFAAVNASAAPAIESYAPAIEALSAANDERGVNYSAQVGASTTVVLQDGSSATQTEFVVTCEDEAGVYARDTYVVVTKEYWELVSIQFQGRTLVNQTAP